MKYYNNTYIDLQPKETEVDTTKKSILPGLTIHRDARIDRKNEIVRYTKFTGKMALRGLKLAARGIEYTFSEMVEAAEHQRQHRSEMAKMGITVKYTLF